MYLNRVRKQANKQANVRAYVRTYVGGWGLKFNPSARISQEFFSKVSEISLISSFRVS